MHPGPESTACAGRSFIPCSVCCPAQREQGGHPWQLPGPQAAWEPPCSAPGPELGRRLRKRGKSSFLIPASDLRESLKAQEAAGGSCCRSCPRGSSRGRELVTARIRPWHGICCSLSLASSFPGGAELAGLPWALLCPPLWGCTPKTLPCPSPSTGWVPATPCAFCIQLC